MKYCPKCGYELMEGSSFCAKCGYSVEVNPNVNSFDNNNYIQNVQKVENSVKKSSGTSKASLTLVIIAIVFSIISVFIAIGISGYYIQSVHSNSLNYHQELTYFKIGAYVLLLPIPGILSIIGFFVGLGSRTKDGLKIAGMILNLISILLCIATAFIIYNIGL